MENSTIIRINDIEIENIKNVVNGKIFLNKIDDETRGSSVVGIYGQNGSGKSALIWAIELIKIAISGKQIPDSFAYYITSNKDYAKVKVDFDVVLSSREYMVYYTLVLKRDNNDHVFISSEDLEYSAKETKDEPKIKKTSILSININSDELVLNESSYGPDVRIKELSAINKTFKQQLIILQAVAKTNNTSYIFNEKLVSLYKDFFNDSIYYNILDSLFFYGRMNLFVLNKNSEMSYNMDILPLTLRFNEVDSITTYDSMPLLLSKNACDIDIFKVVDNAIKQIDILINKIIPGLNIQIVQLDKELDVNGGTKILFELVSNRDGVITPLRYESEGIKKILAILSSLIAMYNDKSIFVAIDELDAGIFEYLLGEILKVIKDTGKGQLIFTSHNLRPLEVLDNSNIYFTTTNPNNKYIQFVGIKNNNNLRSTLLRTIDLGGQKENIYENTDSYQIGKAFRKAGAILDGEK